MKSRITHKIYNVEFKIKVAKDWLDDGISAKVLERRIKEELAGDLCPWATYNEVIITNIKVRKSLTLRRRIS